MAVCFWESGKYSLVKSSLSELIPVGQYSLSLKKITKGTKSIWKRINGGLDRGWVRRQ